MGDQEKTPEPLPPGTREALEAGQGEFLPDLSAEEADRLLRERPPDYQPVEEEAAAEPESEPEPAPEPEETPEPEAEAAPEPEPESEVDPLKLELEELRLRVEKAEVDRKKSEGLASRNASRYGRLLEQMQRNAEVVPRHAESSPDTDVLYPDEQATTAPTRTTAAADPVLQARVAELERRAQEDASDRNQAAVKGAYDDFLADRGLFVPESDTSDEAKARREEIDATIERMAPRVKEGTEEFRDLHLSGPSLRKMVRHVLDSAYLEVRMEALQEQRAKAMERKATQVAERNLGKQAAAITGSGSASAPSSVEKTIEEATAEEADAELIRRFGDGRARRPKY